jgi:hypothetical protein
VPRGRSIGRPGYRWIAICVFVVGGCDRCVWQSAADVMSQTYRADPAIKANAHGASKEGRSRVIPSSPSFPPSQPPAPPSLNSLQSGAAGALVGLDSQIALESAAKRAKIPEAGNKMMMTTFLVIAMLVVLMMTALTMVPRHETVRM